jgi:hypothetical protein
MDRFYGLLAEFDGPGPLLHAAEAVRERGFTRWDCYTPFPVHGLDRAMGLRDSRIAWVVLGAGASGVAVALLMQWWMNAVDYPLLVSGKPLFSVPAGVPVLFEVTVLFAAVTAFVSMFAFNGLPRWYHPVFRSERFRRATTDGFFLAIEAADPRFDVEATEGLLRQLGSRHVEWLES